MLIVKYKALPPPRNGHAESTSEITKRQSIFLIFAHACLFIALCDELVFQNISFTNECETSSLVLRWVQFELLDEIKFTSIKQRQHTPAWWNRNMSRGRNIKWTTQHNEIRVHFFPFAWRTQENFDLTTRRPKRVTLIAFKLREEQRYFKKSLLVGGVARRFR